MAHNLDTALLRAFVTVADTASMTTAASVLHLTQGAISQQVKRLEETFDVTLFERGRRGLTLTDAGERLFGKAKRVLNLNDEIWAEMTTPVFKGQVKLGVPFDLVSTYLPPIMKTYMQAHPHVEISIVCLSSPKLAEALAAGEIDLAIIEAQVGQSDGECLRIDRLVWVGAKGGEAYRRRPVPLSMVTDTCAFRPVVLAALREQGLAWRAVFENGNVEAASATVQTDLAVCPSLASVVPFELEVLPADSGLPDLPNFSINLHLPKTGAGATAQALAKHIREGFLGRYRQAA